MLSKALTLLMCCAVLSGVVFPLPLTRAETATTAKFLPPPGKTLFIVGQDLGAIGGMPDYTEGYVNAMPKRIPGGLTTYTGLHDLGGLEQAGNWGAGDVSAQLLMEQPDFANTTLVIGLFLGGQNLAKINQGDYDANIDRLAKWIGAQKRPVFLRIGYEFDGPWNAYAPEPFVAAWQRIVDRLRALKVANVATVWQSATDAQTFEGHAWSAWYPGDDYVDWFGMSYFTPNAKVFADWLALARKHSKPVMIAEATPRGRDLAKEDGNVVWAAWFAPFFKFIHDNADMIRAVAYINTHWDSQSMWAGQNWGDSRVQANADVLKNWKSELGSVDWLHASPALFNLLQGWQAPAPEQPAGPALVKRSDLPTVPSATGTGSFFTGTYPNLLKEAGYTDAEITAKIEMVWNTLFYGDDKTERVYYPVGDDMAYLLDVNNNDVRSEGMSYGMMLAVQLDKKAEFDRIWKWARTYMYHTDPNYRGFFSWQHAPDGKRLDNNSAPDGETWFVTALFFAAARWGNGDGIFNYEAEANALLHEMIHKPETSKVLTAMFDPATTYVVFVPNFGELSSFSDPSYHAPQYYELWARWGKADQVFWAQAAHASRAFWKIAAHPSTGLMPNYANFDGTPKVWGDYGEFFYADAWRCAMMVGLDHTWFGVDAWQVEQSNRLLKFFHAQGMGSYTSKFRVDGTPASPQHRALGLIAMNAVAGLAADDPIRMEFVREFWETPLNVGQFRYYDNLLYAFALLQLSGNFRIYTPGS
jgi:oligosaccharide reducing-end xylanase